MHDSVVVVAATIRQLAAWGNHPMSAAEEQCPQTSKRHTSARPVPKCKRRLGFSYMSWDNRHASLTLLRILAFAWSRLWAASVALSEAV